ncbi:hypothetical protein BH11MYX3_BH11MYX3_42900 [soil metagenome]
MPPSSPHGWVRRTVELHGELAAIAEVDLQPAWWLLAGGAAAAEPGRPRSAYLISDGAPTADTFIGVRAAPPTDPIRDAIAWAHAARAALRELDGELPDQPLATTILRDRGGAQTVASSLDVAAFAIGDHCVLARLADDIASETALAARLARPAEDRSVISSTPFVCVSIGDEPLATARHGHRRAWIGGAGPWLGIGRSGELALVSTCHFAVDGYGHAWLTSRICAHHTRLHARAPAGDELGDHRLALVDGRVPLGIAWRPLRSPAPRALPLGYALGRALYRVNQNPRARFSPTFPVPVAPGERDDPQRRRRRVVTSTLSVRFVDGEPEPFESFEARARAIIDRDAAGRGLNARLLAAARAAPLSLTWKRAALSTARPRWLDRIAEVVGGRACLSRMRLDVPLDAACAVSSPARLSSADDPLGACVITVIDDGDEAAITACGSGLAGTHAAATELLDELLGLV